MSKVRTPKPDFICIGPTKTGTSWLYTVLRLHPEIWLPPVSEINFYWGAGRRLPRSTWWQNIKQKIKGDIRIRWRKNYARERLTYYRLNPGERTWKKIAWDLKYLFLPQNPLWYKSLFHTEKIAGDITGGYYTLDDQAIQRMARHIPDVKIIMSFRDPVSRLWSEARMILMHVGRKTTDQISDEDFYSRFTNAHARMPSYSALYRRWLKCFPENQVLLCYYDDLLHDPEEYIRRICRFLGVSDVLTPDMKRAIHQKVFEGPRIPFQDRYRKYLIEKTLPCVKELIETMHHPHAGKWLTEYELFMENHKDETAIR
jgi:hypothetical protein